MTNLEVLRNNRNWSRKQLVEIAGHDLTVRMIYSYEREGVNPDIDTLILLADTFGVTVDFLLGRCPDSQAGAQEPPRSFSVLHFGERVQQFRESHGMSKKAVAKDAGITTTYLTVVENGNRIPKFLTAVRILNALGASADFALMDNLDAAVPQKATMLQSQIAALPPEKQRFVLNLLESMIQAVQE